MADFKAKERPLSGFEKAVFAHAGIFLIGATWALGGNAGYVRPPLAVWGSLGAFITLAGALSDKRRSDISRRPLAWLWPLGLFNVLVIASCFTPLLREVQMGASSFLTPIPVPTWRPAAAEPSKALQTLWLFDAIYISCFNIAFVFRHRRGLRGLMALAIVNALVLTVFGTIQRLVGAKGIFFGAVVIPNAEFFSSFIYRNHWGAFILLIIGLTLGLIRYHGRRNRTRGFFHTPAFGGLIAILAFAITLPLSGSRSGSLFAAIILAGAFFNWFRRMIRDRRSYAESITIPVAGAVVAIIVAVSAIWYLAGNVIAVRIATTQEQVATMRERGDIGGRNVLYADTLHMAGDRIWFGWGMASLPHVFWFYNTQPPNPVDRIPVVYHDAHSDWLQALAEHGIFGTALLGLCALVPLVKARQSRFKNPVARYPLVACGLVLIYAMIEFPFGNVAVVLTWWFCFFSALRYAQLERSLMEGSHPVPTVPAAELPAH